MKKFLALLAVLALTLCSVTAVAEEIPTITYDPAVVTYEGAFVALADLGLQFMLPADLVAGEITEDAAAQGTLAIFTTADGTAAFTIGYGALADAEGNPVVDYETLTSIYASLGATDLDVYMVNEIPMNTYTLAESNVMGVMILDGAGNVITFNFMPVTDEAFMTTAQLLITTIMPYAE